MTSVAPKRRQKVPGGGRIRNAVHPEAIEERRIVAPGLDVLQAGPTTEGVVGQVEHVVGLEVGTMRGQQVQALVDLGGQSGAGDHLGHRRHAAVPGRPGAFGHLQHRSAPAQDRAVNIHSHCLRQTPTDHLALLH